MRFLALSALAAAALAQAPGASTTSCRWSYSGTTFDLSSMTLPSYSGGYTAVDAYDNTVSYIFNVCQQVASPDSSTSPPGACTQWDRAYNVNPATAWQIDGQNGPVGDYCYRLGTNASLGWSYGLYDAAYPARGVVLTYSGGDFMFCNQQRTLSLNIVCANVQPSASTYAAGVLAFESSPCNYAVTLPSIAGCPTQCLTGGTVCSGAGVCGYNSDAQRSQCFCNTGYTGALCEARAPPASSGLGTEGVLLVIVCIALTGVLGLVGFMFLKLRKLQIDPSAYGQLQGRFNELGQLM